jgi:hypothetical protein
MAGLHRLMAFGMHVELTATQLPVAEQEVTMVGW